MSASLPSFLQPWRLQVRKDNGDFYHETSSGTECWRWMSNLGSGSFGVVWKEKCISHSSSSPALVRAVKRISKEQAVLTQSSVRELKALITFSDISVPQVSTFCCMTPVRFQIRVSERGNSMRNTLSASSAGSTIA